MVKAKRMDESKSVANRSNSQQNEFQNGCVSCNILLVIYVRNEMTTTTTLYQTTPTARATLNIIYLFEATERMKVTVTVVQSTEWTGELSCCAPQLGYRNEQQEIERKKNRPVKSTQFNSK